MPRFRVVLFSLIALVVAMLAVAGSVPLAIAQDATPETVPHDFPLVPDPALCTGEPGDTQALLDLWFPEGSPVAEAATTEDSPNEVTIPVGQAADEATTDAITTTVYELFSCFAAGDFLRAYAYFTDDLARQFGPEPGTTREDAAAFVEASPVPAAEGEQGAILAVTDAMILDDGRVGAFVVDTSVDGTFTVYAIFEEQEDGRYLVDEVIEFSSDEE
jgi:hypothetical protein